MKGILHGIMILLTQFEKISTTSKKPKLYLEIHEKVAPSGFTSVPDLNEDLILRPLSYQT